jgi:polysaccharide pyruvyl transferase CsaB
LPSLKRVVISGYYGFSNLGDEAVLASIIGGLKQESQDLVDITVLSACPERTEKTYAVKAVPRTSLAKVVKILTNCNLLISGGGSLIQDITSFRSLVYYLSIIYLAKAMGCKVMILGQGIGPLKRSVSKYLATVCLNRTDLITVRDNESLQLLSKLGVCKPPIHLTADPTLLLTPCSMEESKTILSRLGFGNGEPFIVASFRRWHQIQELERIAAKTLRILSDQLSTKILLITMQLPDDVIIAKRISELAQSPNIVVQPEPWSPSQLLGILNNSSLVIGMRLHSLIFAATVGIPSVGLAYDPKVESFQVAVGQKSLQLHNLNTEQFIHSVLDMWNARDSMTEKLQHAIPKMKEAAFRNIQLALQLLNI